MKRFVNGLLIIVFLLTLVACEQKVDNYNDDKKESTSIKEEENKEGNDGNNEKIGDSKTVEVKEDNIDKEGKKEIVFLNVGDKIENSNFRMTFDSIELLSEYSYRTGSNSTSFLYVEDGYKLVVLKGHFDNLSTNPIYHSSFVRSALVNGEYKVQGDDIQFHFHRNTYFEIDPYTDLDFVMAVNVPAKLADMIETVEFTIGYNDDLSSPTTIFYTDRETEIEADNFYSIKHSFSEPQVDSETSVDRNKADTKAEIITKTVKDIFIGDVIKTDDYEYTLNQVELTYELLPSDTSGIYRSYPADSGKVYINIAGSLKNLMKRDIRLDETFIARAVYSDDYNYNGFVVVDEGSKFRWLGSDVAGTPLETCKIHYLIPCPDEVAVTDEKLSVILTMSDGQQYRCVIR